MLLLSRSLCIWWKGVYLQRPPKPVSVKTCQQQRIPGCFSFNLTVTLLQPPHSPQSSLYGWQEHTDCPNQDFCCCCCCSFQILFWQGCPICSAVAPGSHDKGKKRLSDKARAPRPADQIQSDPCCSNILVNTASVAEARARASWISDPLSQKWSHLFLLGGCVRVGVVSLLPMACIRHHPIMVPVTHLEATK